MSKFCSNVTFDEKDYLPIKNQIIASLGSNLQYYDVICAHLLDKRDKGGFGEFYINSIKSDKSLWYDGNRSTVTEYDLKGIVDRANKPNEDSQEEIRQLVELAIKYQYKINPDYVLSRNIDIIDKKEEDANGFSNIIAKNDAISHCVRFINEDYNITKYYGISENDKRRRVDSGIEGAIKRLATHLIQLGIDRTNITFDGNITDGIIESIITQLKNGNVSDKNLGNLIELVTNYGSNDEATAFVDNNIINNKDLAEFRHETPRRGNVVDVTFDTDDDDNAETYETPQNSKDDSDNQNDDGDKTLHNLIIGDNGKTDFMKNIDGIVFNLLNNVRKGVIINGQFVPNSLDSLGLETNYTAKELIALIHSVVDFTNVDTMINSIRENAKNIYQFGGLSILANTLSADRNLAMMFYFNLGEIVKSKIKTSTENNGKVTLSNKRIDREDCLRFEYMNSVRTGYIINDIGVMKKTLNEINKDIDGIKISNSKEDNSEHISNAINLLYKGLNSYYSTISQEDILSFVYNHAGPDGKIDIKHNISSLRSVLRTTIENAEEAQLAYNAYAGNLTKKGYAKYKENVSPFGDNFRGASNLAELMKDYTYVKTEINSTNIDGNLTSDTLPSSLMTYLTNILNNPEALTNYGLDKLRGTQYDLSTILYEQKDDNGEIINYGLFTRDGNNIVPTKYAKELLEINLFDGVSNENGSRTSLYANMSDNDFLAAALINFSKTETPFGSEIKDNKVSFATYFTRIPSDAPKIYTIRGLKYSTDDLITNIVSDENLKAFADKSNTNVGDINSLIDGLSKLDASKLENLESITEDEYTKAVEARKKEEGSNGNTQDVKNRPDTIKEIIDGIISGKYKRNKDGSLNSPSIVVTKNKIVSNGKSGEKIVSFVKYQYGDSIILLRGNRRNEVNILANPEIVGIYGTQEDADNFNRNYIINNRSLHKEYGVSKKINSDARMFKIFRNVVYGEFNNMYDALHLIFDDNSFVKTTEGAYVLSNDNKKLKFKNGAYVNPEGIQFNSEEEKAKAVKASKEAEKELLRRLYANYHYKSNKLFERDDRGIVIGFTGNVFTSDRFAMYNESDGKIFNPINELLTDDTFNFFYGGDTNEENNTTRRIKFNSNGKIVFDNFQKEKIDEALKQFIIAYVTDAENRLDRVKDILGENITTDSIADFILNYHLFYINSNDVFEGDTKFYKDVQTLLKRAKETQASGRPYGITDFNRSQNNNQNDSLDKYGLPLLSSSLDTYKVNAKWGNNKSREIRLRGKWRAITITNTVKPTDKIIADTIRKQLEIAGVDNRVIDNLLKGFTSNTKVNDAQSYITFEEWVRRITARGQLPKYKDVIEAVQNGTPLTAEQMISLIQVQKNFYYDFHYDEFTKRDVPRQIKNAEFVLVPQFIKGTDLEKVYDFMMENGIDQINTSETSKAAQNNILTIWDNEGKLVDRFGSDEFIKEVNDAIETFDYNYLYTQIETPQHMDGMNKAAIQITKKIVDNIQPEYDKDGNPTGLYKLKLEYFDTYTAKIKESFKKLADEFGFELDENGDPKYDENGHIVTKYKHGEKSFDRAFFYERLREEGERLGLDSNQLDYVTLDADGNPIMPDYMSIFSKKLESIAQSIFNSRITRQKLHGFHAAQVTGVGAGEKLKYHPAKNSVAVSTMKNQPDYKEYLASLDEETRNEVLKNEDTKENREAYGKWLESNNKDIAEAYIEVKLPYYSKNMFTKYDENGTPITKDITVKDLERLGLDKFIGYRIPTEGKQSISVMKIVGFLDPAQGSTIMVPDEWVTQTGSDFDIDSIYGITFQTIFGKKGITKVTYSEDERVRYQKYVIAKSKELEGKFNSNTANKITFLEYKENVDKKLSDIKDSINKVKIDYFDSLSEEFVNFYNNLSNESVINFRVKGKIESHRLKSYIKNSFKFDDKNLTKDDITSIIGANDFVYKLRKIFGQLDINIRNNENNSEFQKLYDMTIDMNIIFDDLDAAYAKKKDILNRLNEVYAKKKDILDRLNAAYDIQATRLGILSFEEFKKLSLAEQIDDNSRDNKLLQIMIDIMSDRKSLEENLSRSKFDHITEEKNDCFKHSRYGKERAGRSAYSILDQAAFQQDVTSGMKLKGFSVTRDTFNSICNTCKATVTKGITVIYKDTKENLARIKAAYENSSIKTKDGLIYLTLDRIGWSNNNKNVVGELITVYSSETTAYILDAVKEGSIPNVNDFTFGAYKTFVDLGADYGTSVPFMMQAGVSRIVRHYNSNKSVFSDDTYNRPIEQAIKEICVEYIKLNKKDDDKTNYNVYMPIETLLNAVNSKLFDRYVNGTDVVFDGTKYKHRLTDDYKEHTDASQKLLDELENCIEFKTINDLSKTITDYARVLNPDKFGAKQTIYSTEKVINDIKKLIETENYIKVDKNNLLEAIYPSFSKNPTNKSLYPTLDAFLKYVTIPSFSFNSMLFQTESKDFKDKVLSIENYIKGSVNESLYEQYKQYILHHIYKNTRIGRCPATLDLSNKDTFGEIVYYDGSDINYDDENRRVFGFGRPAVFDFNVEDINNITQEEINTFATFSPAQQIFWIQTHYSNSGIFDLLKISLFNEYEYKQKGSSRQTIKFVDDNVNVETAISAFEDCFYSNDPILRLASINLIKYAIIVEGLSFKRNGISKIIKNSALYNNVGDGRNVSKILGTGFISDCNTGIQNVSNLNEEELATSFIRSHSSIYQIPRTKLKKSSNDNSRFELDFHNDMIVMEINDKNIEYLKKYNIVNDKHEDSFGNVYYDANGFVVLGKYNLKTKQTQYTLYKIVRDLDGNIAPDSDGRFVVRAYPINLLESYEDEEFSSNMSYDVHPSESYYRDLIAGISADRSRYLVNKELYKVDYSGNDFSLTKSYFSNASEEALNNIAENIENAFSNPDTTSYTFRSLLIDKYNYVPYGIGRILRIGNNSYRIQHLNKSYYSNINKGDNTYELLSDNEKKLVDEMKNNGLKYYSDLFRVTKPENVKYSRIRTIIEENDDNNDTIADIIENYAIMLDQNSTKKDDVGIDAIHRLSDLGIKKESSTDARGFNKKSIIDNKDKALSIINGAIEEYKSRIIGQIENFGGVGVPMNHPDVIAKIKDNEIVRNEFLKLLNEIERFAKNYELFDSVVFDSDDSNIKKTLNEIRNNINAITSNPTLVDAKKAFVNKVISSFSDNPVIQQQLISITDGYNYTGTFGSLIGDIRNAPNPIVQVIMKEVMSSIEAKRFKATELARKFNKDVEDIRKRAEGEGIKIDTSKFIKDGRFIQNFTDEFVEELSSRYEKYRVAQERLHDLFKPGVSTLGENNTKNYKIVLEAITAEREWNKFKFEHLNQLYDSSYYRLLYNAQSKLLKQNDVDVDLNEDQKNALSYNDFKHKLNKNRINDDDSIDFTKAYVEYYFRIQQRNDALRNQRGGVIDDAYKQQLDEAYSVINDILSDYVNVPGIGMFKKSPEVDEMLNDSDYLKKYRLHDYFAAYESEVQSIKKSYQDRKTRIGYNEEFTKNLEYVTKKEKKHPNGDLIIPHDELIKDPEYVKAKEWLRLNTTHNFIEEDAKILSEAYKTLSRKASSTTVQAVKTIRNKYPMAIDVYGYFNPSYEYTDATGTHRVVDDKKFGLIKEQDNIRLGNTETYGEFSDRILISNAQNDEIYSQDFYKSLTTDGTKNGKYIKIVQAINEILIKGLTEVDDKPYLNTTSLSAEDLDNLNKLYEELDSIKHRLGSSRYSVEKFIDFIKERCKTSYNEKAFAYERNKAEDIGGEYFEKWKLVNQTSETNEEDYKNGFAIKFVDRNGETHYIIPNSHIYGYIKPNDKYESIYHTSKEKAKEEALRTINRLTYVENSPYYEETYRSFYTDKNSSEEAQIAFNKWFVENHVFNPYTHKYQPTSIWTITKNKEEYLEYKPKNNQTEPEPSEIGKNDNYKENVPQSQNYVVGSGYDNRFDTLNSYERELRDLYQQTINSIAKTPVANRRAEEGYLPTRAKSPEINATYLLKQAGYTFGISTGSENEDNGWLYDVDYANDYIPDMPMFTQLIRGIKDKEKRLIPKRNENESFDEYEARIAEDKKYNAEIDAEIKKANDEIRDEDWDSVIHDFIINGSDYNARQESKHMLYFALDELKDMKRYIDRAGIKNYVRDKKHSTSERPEYKKDSMTQTEELMANTIRRIVFNQYKEKNGNLTKGANILQNMSSAKYMMMNITGGIANVTYGTAQIAMERLAGEYFEKKDLAKADSDYFSSTPDFFKHLYDDKSDSLSGAIIKFFDVIDHDRIIENTSKFDTLEAFNRFRNFLYSPQSVGEHYMQNRALIAMTYSNKVVKDLETGKITIMSRERYLRQLDEDAVFEVIGNNEELKNKFKEFIVDIKRDPNKVKDYARFRRFLNTEFMRKYFSKEQMKEYSDKVNSLRKDSSIAFDNLPSLKSQFEVKDGYLSIKQGSLIDTLSEDEKFKLLGEFKQKVILVNEKIHGVYNKIGAARIESKWYGGMVMQYHKHLYPGLCKVYRRQGYYNEFRGSVEKGYFTTILNFISTPIDKVLENKRPEDRLYIEGFHNFAKYSIDFIMNVKLYYNILPDSEKANIRRALSNIAACAIAFAGALATQLIADDDDEDNLWYNLSIYETDRLMSELSTYGVGLFGETKKLYSSPIPSFGTISDITKTLGVVASYISDDDKSRTFTSGIYAGENKFKVYLTRQIPVYRSLHRLNTLDKSNKSYKLSENMLGIFDVKQIAEDIKR